MERDGHIPARVRHRQLTALELDKIRAENELLRPGIETTLRKKGIM